MGMKADTDTRAYQAQPEILIREGDLGMEKNGRE